jgi:hypothetical protein
MRMAPTSSRKRGPTPRACLADRIAEFGLEDVLYTLERFAVICVHEPDQRKWWCPDMFSPTRWPPIRSTVASGTGKRFRHDRERTEYETRTGGRHDWPSVPRNVIVAGERIDDGPMDYMDDSKIPF